MFSFSSSSATGTLKRVKKKKKQKKKQYNRNITDVSVWSEHILYILDQVFPPFLWHLDFFLNKAATADSCSP